MPEADAQPSDDMADWLQEVAKRPWASERPLLDPAPRAERDPVWRRILQTGHRLQHGRELIGFAALVAGYLQYYYVDVMLQISCLPPCIAFV